MEQSTDKNDKATSQTSYTETPFVEVTKEFNAPIEKVWKAWSDPVMFKEWWGPETYTCPHAEIDFRIDGKYFAAMEAPDGQVTWSTGIYKEILPHELIVCTDQFADENGNPITPEEADVIEADWGGRDTFIFSVKFDKINENKTKIQLVHEGLPASMHDDCVDGWSTSLDKMKRLVERN